MNKDYEKEILSILNGLDVNTAKNILQDVLSRIDLNSIVITQNYKTLVSGKKDISIDGKNLKGSGNVSITV